MAHFLIQAMQGHPITLFGDGMQVRDVLFVEDLVDAFLLARSSATRLGGNAYNIGGGPKNTTSLIELLRLIGDLEGQKPQVSFRDWRIGDQRYYVSDTSAFHAATGWQARVGVSEGVGRLHSWLSANVAQERVALSGGAQ